MGGAGERSQGGELGRRYREVSWDGELGWGTREGGELGRMGGAGEGAREGGELGRGTRETFLLFFLHAVNLSSVGSRISYFCCRFKKSNQVSKKGDFDVR